MKIKIHPGKENPIHAGQYITSSVLWQCVVTNASSGTNGGLGCSMSIRWKVKELKQQMEVG